MKPGSSPIPPQLIPLPHLCRPPRQETAWPKSMGAGWSFKTKLLKLECACESPRALVKIPTLIAQVWARGLRFCTSKELLGHADCAAGPNTPL